MAANHVKERTPLGRVARVFKEMGKPGKVGWQHGWQRGLCKRGANVNSSNQHLRWEM